MKELQELIRIIRSEVLTEERKAKEIRAILDENPDFDVNLANSFGDTLLHIASKEGHLEVVKALLAIKGINVNCTNSIGDTPLYAASERGYLEVVKALLGKNSDVNAADDRGWTALLTAAGSGHSEVVEELLKYNADVNAAEKDDSCTPLFLASQRGYLEVVKVLLKNNAKVNLTTWAGLTALFTAADEGYPEVVEELLKYNPDVNAANIFGDTPLSVASLNYDTGVAQLIIEYMLIQNKTKPDSLSGKLLNYWDECEQMQRRTVGNSEISFFDILVADKKKLASYVNDYDVVEALDEYDCEKEFSICAGRIKRQYIKGMIEKIAPDIVLNLSDALNEYTSRMIFDHLDYKEIRDLCIAGYLNLIEERHANAEAAHEQLVEDEGVVRSNSSDINVEKHSNGKSVTPQQNRT